MATRTKTIGAKGAPRSQLPAEMDPASPDYDVFKSPFFLMARAISKYQQDLEVVMERMGSDRTIYRLMTILLQVRRGGIKRICEDAMLKLPTGSRAVERMRAKGWINSETSQTDARETEIELTSAGTRVALELRKATSLQLYRAVDGLSTEQIKQMAACLQQLSDNLSRLPIE